MQGQLEAPGSSPSPGFSSCMAVSCAAPAMTQLEERRLCLEHFVGDSIHAIESRRRQLQDEHWDTGAVESFKAFVAGCTAQAKELLESHQDTVSPAKDRLLDLLLLTSHLNQHLRRSPRSPASVLVWLRREDPGQTWEEETWTSTISLHGAGLACRHRVEPGQTVYLCRKDKGGRAQARIVYAQYDAAGDRQIGLEILDREDFWSTAELAPSSESGTTAAPAQDVTGDAKKEAVATVQADVEIQSGAQPARHERVPLELISRGEEIRLSGVLSLEAHAASDAHANSSAERNPVRISITWKKPA